VNTEITDKEKFEGWVLYDANCQLCVRLAHRFRNTLVHRRFELLPLQTLRTRRQLGLSESELMTEMRLLKPSGIGFGGADALLKISRHFWWAWPFQQLGRIPPVMNLFRAGYRWIARNRGCLNSACKVVNAKKTKSCSRKRIVFFEMP